jgi:RNA polymerase sigma factor (TIGR02999 family)
MRGKMGDTGTIQELLERWQAGDRAARDHLVARLHPELSAIAAARLRNEHNSSLSTGDLINDAVLNMMKLDRITIVNRAHFLALASRLMRQILVDYARAKLTDKRNHYKVELNSRVEGEQRFDLHLLDSALIRLGVIDMDLAELVEMRYFGGMTLSDMAVVTGVSEATLKRRWQAARAWLTDALSNPIEDA